MCRRFGGSTGATTTPARTFHGVGVWAVVRVALILLARWKTEAKLQFFASIFHLDGRVDAVELRSVGLE